MKQINSHSPLQNHFPMDETTLLKNLFLLGEVQRWLNEACDDLIDLVSGRRTKSGTYENIYLTVPALWEILSSTYHKLQEKTSERSFTIPVMDILAYLKEGSSEPTEPLPGCSLRQTIINTGRMIGYDRRHFPTCFITIISQSDGKIVTAYPGFAGTTND